MHGGMTAAKSAVEDMPGTIPHQVDISKNFRNMS
jgi:hypothetical protein